MENSGLKALNAAIPHVDLKYQKKLAIAVKMMELKEICRHYDNLEAQGARAQNPRWKQDMISAVMPYLSEEKQQGLKTMAQMMEMQEVMANFEAFKELSEWI